MLENYEGVLDDVELQLSEADKILKNAQNQQQITDDLLADADFADSIAEEAVKLGNKTLQEAQQTYKTLQGLFIYFLPNFVIFSSILCP